jgi:hypothetical protein
MVTPLTNRRSCCNNIDVARTARIGPHTHSPIFSPSVVLMKRRPYLVSSITIAPTPAHNLHIWSCFYIMTTTTLYISTDYEIYHPYLYWRFTVSMVSADKFTTFFGIFTIVALHAHQCIHLHCVPTAVHCKLVHMCPFPTQIFMFSTPSFSTFCQCLLCSFLVI